MRRALLFTTPPMCRRFRPPLPPIGAAVHWLDLSLVFPPISCLRWCSVVLCALLQLTLAMLWVAARLRLAVAMTGRILAWPPHNIRLLKDSCAAWCPCPDSPPSRLPRVVVGWSSGAPPWLHVHLPWLPSRLPLLCDGNRNVDGDCLFLDYLAVNSSVTFSEIICYKWRLQLNLLLNICRKNGKNCYQC
jgi:hypothetical protein